MREGRKEGVKGSDSLIVYSSCYSSSCTLCYYLFVSSFFSFRSVISTCSTVYYSNLYSTILISYIYTIYSPTLSIYNILYTIVCWLFIAIGNVAYREIMVLCRSTNDRVCHYDGL